MKSKQNKMELVRIIMADINQFTDNTEQILMQIPPHYAEKYQRIKIHETAMHELISGLLLNKYMGIERDNQLFYNEHGKPLPISGEKHFNLSHSGDYVVLAIANSEVGVDIEKIRPCHDAIVKKYFNIKQKDEMLLAGDDKQNRDKMFTKIWTGFEAMLKLKGTGFGEDWDREKGPLEKCSVQTFEIDNYFISIATEKQVRVEIERV